MSQRRLIFLASMSWVQRPPLITVHPFLMPMHPYRLVVQLEEHCASGIKPSGTQRWCDVVEKMADSRQRVLKALGQENATKLQVMQVLAQLIKRFSLVEQSHDYCHEEHASHHTSNISVSIPFLNRPFI